MKHYHINVFMYILYTIQEIILIRYYIASVTLVANPCHFKPVKSIMYLVCVKKTVSDDFLNTFSEIIIYPSRVDLTYV